MPAAVPPRILIIRRRYLGDIVLLGSFIRNLRLHWPEADVAVLVEERFAELLALNPNVTRVWALPASSVKMLRLLATLRRQRFSHIFDLDNNDRSALLSRITDAPFRAVLQMRERFASWYTHRSRVIATAYHTQHITETYLQLLQTSDVPVRTREVKLTLRPSDHQAARAIFSAHEKTVSPRLLIHPGSRSAYRVWPSERFAEVIDRAVEKFQVIPYLVGGPSEVALMRAIGERVARKVVLLDQSLSITTLAAVARSCATMFCHDSGPMHVAAAVGTPIVALFGSQNLRQWAPLGSHHVVLQAPQPCVDCVAPADCAPDDSYRNYCVKRLSVNEVFTAVSHQLSGIQREPAKQT